MSDHLLILSDDEVRLLGALYSLGAMAALTVLLGQEGEHEERVFQEARRLMSTVMTAQVTLQTRLRDRILELQRELEPDGQRQDD